MGKNLRVMAKSWENKEYSDTITVETVM